MVEAPKAWISRPKWFTALVVLALLFVIAWSLRHGLAIASYFTHKSADQMLWVWFFVFGALVWHWALAWFEPTHKATPRQRRNLDELKVKVNVPVFNEDPETLKRVLLSLLNQTRPPDLIEVVENGINKQTVDLSAVQHWFETVERPERTEVSWVRVVEEGKRAGQLVTLRRTGYEIMITTDSDTIPSPNCIEEGMLPFHDPNIVSVASVVLAQNPTKPLVRLTDAWLLAFQLSTRAAMSRLGCVLVNSGNFSLYRMAPLEDALQAYESETFAGRPVQFSDDSLLTLFSYLKGKTVQQPTSIAFTVLPTNLGHHLRQQLRWMRGSTIRSIWRFRYLPIKSFAYWEHFISWVNFTLVSFAFAYLIVWLPIVDHRLAATAALFAVAVAYLTSMRYLTVRRSDMSFGSQIFSWLIAPAMLLWTAIVLRPLRFYAMATCWKTEWGTRGKVEVALEAA